MGADYCWMCVEVPTEFATIDHETVHYSIDAEGYQRYLTETITMVPASVRRELAIQSLGVGDDDETDDEIIEAWQGAIAVVLECARGQRRDASWSVVSGSIIIHSGGLSWGEGPTDAFDALVALDAIEWEARR